MKRIVSLLLVMAMILVLVSACGSTATTSTSSLQDTEESTVEASIDEQTGSVEEESIAEDIVSVEDEIVESVTEEPAEEVELPIYTMPLTAETVTISIFIADAPAFVTMYLGEGQSYNTSAVTEFMKTYAGIEMDYHTYDVMSTSASDQLSLMIASGDYTDLISGLGDSYAGGLTKAYEDGIIIDLTDMVEKNMPYYKSFMDSNNEYAKEIRNDDGQILQIASWTDEAISGFGTIIRGDFLDALGLDVPTTYDELHNVAVAIKNEYGSSSVFYLSNNLNPGAALSAGYDLPAWDISSTETEWYQVDGTVKYAYTEDSMKEYLKMLNTWYSEGLFSSDYISQNGGQAAEGPLSTGDSAITWSQASAVDEFVIENDGYLIGIPDIQMTENQTLHFSNLSDSQFGENTVSVTVSCDNLDILAEWLDYMWTDEGIMYCNYGMEGYSYELHDDGTAHFLDEVLNNSEGLNFKQTTETYLLYGMPTLFDADRSIWDQYGEVTIESIKAWNSNTRDNAYDMPQTLLLTTEESAQYAAYITDLETIASEYINKFVVGELSIDDDWNTYISAMESAGLEDAIAIKTAAYERYQNR